MYLSTGSAPKERILFMVISSEKKHFDFYKMKVNIFPNFVNLL